MDAYGNTLAAVNVPVTGFVAVNFTATQPPSFNSIATGALPTGYEYLGLLTDDGGYSEDFRVGDLVQLFDGRFYRCDDESASFTVTCAEDNPTVRVLLGVTGDTPQAKARAGAAISREIGVVAVTKYANGAQTVRGGIANITDVSHGDGERGSVATAEIEFQWRFSPNIDGYYRVVNIEP